MADALSVFLDSIDNCYTRNNYRAGFMEFLRWTGKDTPDDLLAIEPKAIEDLVVAYIKHLTSRGIAPSSVRAKFASVKQFYVQNRLAKAVDWEWAAKRLPKNQRKVKDRDYNIEELRKAWGVATPQQRELIGLLLSGIRRGALTRFEGDPPKIEGLRYRHLTKVTEFVNDEGKKVPFEAGAHLYKLTIYEGDPDNEYYCFTTFEAAKAIDMATEYRQKAGEIITGDTWVLRADWAIERPNDVKPITQAGINSQFARLMRKAGVRTLGENCHTRRDVMLFHGVRKYVNSRMIDAGVEYSIKEWLIGHTNGLEKNYMRSQENKALREWLRVIPLLTISREQQLQKQVERLQVKVADVETMKSAYLKLKDDYDRLRAQHNVSVDSGMIVENKLFGIIESLEARIRHLEGKPDPRKLTDEQYEKTIAPFVNDPNLQSERDSMIQRELERMRKAEATKRET